MPIPDTLVIIHYHLLPGGVCSAIKNSVFALGRMDGVEEFVRFLDQWGIKGQVEVDARLDYSDRVWPDQDTFWDDASALATWLLRQGRGTSLFWTHNPTLGKPLSAKIRW
jgi:hypothetical protein